jgi:signal transduction histidine kinase
MSSSSPLARLRRLADRVLEVPDVDSLSRLLTRELPGALGVSGATLLLWDRKLEVFDTFSPGETRIRRVRPGESSRPAPEARYLISDGQLLETKGGDEGCLLPLMARTGLAGMLVLGPRRRRRTVTYRPSEVRVLSLLARRSALALENHIYLKELIASERVAALGTMAGMLAHDLRGPLTVIRGYAETLLEAGLPQEEIRDRAQIIIEMVDRLERMTTETLDFAREGGSLALRPVGIAVFLEDLAAGLSLDFPGLDVVRDFGGVPAGTAAGLDVDKLRRAVDNIAANARDAMGGRGRLHLTATVEGGEGDAPPALALTLADEGPGVPEGLRERLFEPFITLGKKGGTGLGLTVARRFVEDHGGRLDLLPGGSGARFRITLPLAASVSPAGVGS